MKDIDLRILENAEDDIVEELVPFSPDEDQVMKRVLAMSEKKYKDLIRHQDKEKEQDNRKGTIKSSETVVEGVEVYHRPAWYKPLCAAAAFILIACGLGTGFAFSRKARLSGVSQPDPTTTAETTELTTEAPAKPEDILPKEEEMKGVFEELFPVFSEFSGLCTEDYFSRDWESINFDLRSYDGELYETPFYKVEDERFSTYDEMVEYYSRYFFEPAELLPYAGDVSDHQAGDVLDDCNFLEYNGALYVRGTLKRAETQEEWNHDILSDRAFFVKPDSFMWERVVKNEENDVTFAYALTMEFKKSDDGVWKILSYNIMGTQYEEGKDYTASEYPLLEGGPSFRADDDIDFDSVMTSVQTYLEGYNENFYAYNAHWDMMTELPDSYYHVTDDFRNNNRWIRVVLEPYPGDDTDTRVLYVDGYGVVFGEEY